MKKQEVEAEGVVECHHHERRDRAQAIDLHETLATGGARPGAGSVQLELDAHMPGAAPLAGNARVSQTYRELEVIVVDDGSTDETGSIIGTAYAREPRVRYLRQANRGVAGARNAGLELARGEFIALLDSDDLWMPWKIELQVRCMQR